MAAMGAKFGGWGNKREIAAARIIPARKRNRVLLIAILLFQ
jgi:hypothetical protein